MPNPLAGVVSGSGGIANGLPLVQVKANKLITLRIGKLSLNAVAALDFYLVVAISSVIATSNAVERLDE